MTNVKSVLFVCTGNSCRSVMAEGLLKKYLKELGKNDIMVRSAGTRAASGMGATDETVEVMKAEGVDVSGFKSARLTDHMIKDSDLILVMEPLHALEVIRKAPEASGKVFLLKEYAKADGAGHPHGMDVPDPIGRPLKDYKTCLAIIKKEIERIARLL